MLQLVSAILELVSSVWHLVLASGIWYLVPDTLAPLKALTWEETDLEVSILLRAAAAAGFEFE